MWLVSIAFSGVAVGSCLAGTFMALLHLRHLQWSGVRQTRNSADPFEQDAEQYRLLPPEALLEQPWPHLVLISRAPKNLARRQGAPRRFAQKTAWFLKKKSCRASWNDRLNFTFCSIISFFVFYAEHDHEWVGWSPSQLAQQASERWLSNVCSHDAHFAHLARVLHVWDRCLKHQHLKYQRRFGT